MIYKRLSHRSVITVSYRRVHQVYSHLQRVYLLSLPVGARIVPTLCSSCISLSLPYCIFPLQGELLELPALALALTAAAVNEGQATALELLTQCPFPCCLLLARCRHAAAFVLLNLPVLAVHLPEGVRVPLRNQRGLCSLEDTEKVPNAGGKLEVRRGPVAAVVAAEHFRYLVAIEGAITDCVDCQPVWHCSIA